MSEVNYHKIQCPECKHEFLINDKDEEGRIVITPYPFRYYTCPQCHYYFSPSQVKRTEPITMWDLIRAMFECLCK